MNCAVATCVGGVGSEAAAAVFGLKSVKICEKSCQTLKNTVVEIWLVVRKGACYKYVVKSSKYLGPPYKSPQFDWLSLCLYLDFVSVGFFKLLE